MIDTKKDVISSGFEINCYFRLLLRNSSSRPTTHWNLIFFLLHKENVKLKEIHKAIFQQTIHYQTLCDHFFFLVLFTALLLVLELGVFFSTLFEILSLPLCCFITLLVLFSFPCFISLLACKVSVRTQTLGSQPRTLLPFSSSSTVIEKSNIIQYVWQKA